jgi:hypothetical protein
MLTKSHGLDFKMIATLSVYFSVLITPPGRPTATRDKLQELKKCFGSYILVPGLPEESFYFLLIGAFLERGRRMRRIALVMDPSQVAHSCAGT